MSRPLPSAARMSTRKTERPSVLRLPWSAGVVRRSRSIRSEWSAREVHTFWPFTTYLLLPRRSARVFSLVVSVPEVGSVTPHARGRAQRRAGAAVFLRDERAEEAGLRERGDEVGWIGFARLEIAPVGARELLTHAAH